MSEGTLEGDPGQVGHGAAPPSTGQYILCFYLVPGVVLEAGTTVTNELKQLYSWGWGGEGEDRL